MARRDDSSDNPIYRNRSIEPAVLGVSWIVPEEVHGTLRYHVVKAVGNGDVLWGTLPFNRLALGAINTLDDRAIVEPAIDDNQVPLLRL